MSLQKKLSLFLILLVSGSLLLSCTEAQESKETAKETPRNIILMIGDGMGLNQIYGAMTTSEESLVFEQFSNIGLQETNSADNYITDSGASGTALATGAKTNNEYISISPNGDTLTTILEHAERAGLATGLVSTSSILHATPAAFIAHNKSRHNYYELATDFLKTDIDVFIGGGYKHFADREDGRNLVEELRQKDYNIFRELDEIKKAKKGKIAGFTAEEHNPSYTDGRGDMLPVSTQTALRTLNNNEKGFFLMVEGSQIDWGGHENNSEYVMNELMDFNRAVEKAMEFVRNNPRTLLVVTSDHETGGLTLTGGSLENNEIDASFSSDGHTAALMPVFATGPGAEKFKGMYDNTDIFKKMMELYDFDK